MKLTKWDPFRELDDYIDRYVRAINSPLLKLNKEAAHDWVPPVEIIETESDYQIKLDVPGIKKDDIKIVIENDMITIKGERKRKIEEKDVLQHRVERSYGSFMRSFNMPANVDEKKIEGEYTDGILNLRLPKTEKTKPKSIEVKIN